MIRLKIELFESMHMAKEFKTLIVCKSIIKRENIHVLNYYIKYLFRYISICIYYNNEAIGYYTVELAS